MSNAEQFAPKTPAAVKAAAARATELQNQIINPPKEGEEGEPPEEGEEGAPPKEGEESAPPEKKEAAPPAPPPESDDEKSWEHRFKSMQGRFNGAREQIKTLSQEVSNLNRLLATVQKPEAPKAPAEPPKGLVTPEELAEYGPELVDMMSRVAKQATAPYQQEIDNLKNQLKQVGGSVAASARAQLMESLQEQVPNWAELNDSQDFLDWLALPDPYSGDIRHNMLRSAFDRNDTRRVINFFKGFLAETAATAPAEQEPGTSAISPNGKTSLKHLAAPGRAKSTAAPPKAPDEKPIFTTSQIAAFYTDKANGKYRGREDVAKKFEADIFLAQAEGRIQQR